MKYLNVFDTLKSNPLWLFSILCLLAALACFIAMRQSEVMILGVNKWLKPLKFYLSIAIFLATLAIYLRYLNHSVAVHNYGWSMTILLGYELICITIQAARGRRSHFNNDTGPDIFIAITMGLAILIAMAHTAYMTYLFFSQQVFAIPDHLVLAIRLGFIGLILFSLEGVIMVKYLKHTVGAADGSKGLPLVNWSLNHGDLRAAHFFGMHALQLLPLCAYLFAHTRLTVWIISICYFTYVTFIFIQALQAKPFIK